MNDNQLRQLIERFGYSWKGYRKVRKGVRKRLRRRLQELGCPSTESYLQELERNAAERRRCRRLLSVSVSRFFRDRKLWECLGQDIFPSLIRQAHESVRIWSAGCACGEEPYSITMLWHSLTRTPPCKTGLHVLATDLNPCYLQRAKEGTYPASSLRDVPENLRSRYFRHRKDAHSYAVKDFLKDAITWKVQDLFFETPKARFQVIFLRNSLMTYYEERSRMPVLRQVLGVLSPGGILVIGSHERLPAAELGLTPYGSLPCVFQREPENNGHWDTLAGWKDPGPKTQDTGLGRGHPSGECEGE
jgi:chemotaxis protein methyltransferase CheR